MAFCPLGRCSLSETKIRPRSVVETFRVFLGLEICRQQLLRGVCVHMSSSQKVACVLTLKRWNCGGK